MLISAPPTSSPRNFPPLAITRTVVFVCTAAPVSVCAQAGPGRPAIISSPIPTRLERTDMTVVLPRFPRWRYRLANS